MVGTVVTLEDELATCIRNIRVLDAKKKQTRMIRHLRRVQGVRAGELRKLMDTKRKES